MQNQFIRSMVLHNHIKLQWNVRMVPIPHNTVLAKICTHVLVSLNIVFLYISTPSVNNKDRRQKLINAKLIYYKYCIVLLYNHIKLQWNVRMVPILHSSCINMHTWYRVLEYCLLAHFYMVTFEWV